MPADLLLAEGDRTGSRTRFRVWLDCGCPYEFSLPWPQAPLLRDLYDCPSHEEQQPATLMYRLP